MDAYYTRCMQKKRLFFRLSLYLPLGSALIFFVYVFVCLSVSISVSHHLCLPLYVPLFFYPLQLLDRFLVLFVYLQSLHVCLSLSVSVCLPFCLPVYLSPILVFLFCFSTTFTLSVFHNFYSYLSLVSLYISLFVPLYLSLCLSLPPLSISIFPSLSTFPPLSLSFPLSLSL